MTVEARPELDELGTRGGPERRDRVVSVVPDVPALRKSFDYRVPRELDAQVRLGSQVRVELHGRRVGGWVVADGVEAEPGVDLRPLLGARGWGPPAGVLELAGWAAWRWAGTVVSLLRTASPAVVVRSLPGRPGAAPGALPAPAPLPPGPSADPLRPGRGEGASLGAGTIEQVAGEALAQGIAVVRLAPVIDPAPFWEAAADRLGPGSSEAGVLVLAPETERAAQVARRLRAGGRPVALLPGEWARARAGGVVAVGTRAAAFAPLPRLAAALVLDAHDQAYHEERAPTWHAWGVVAERARRDGAPCALVSPCPGLEISAAGRLVTTSRHAERLGWPAVEVVDRRGDDPRRGLFSARLVDGVRWAVGGRDRRIVCIVNRTGGARLVLCAACDEPARCETCGTALELVDEAALTAPSSMLRCRRCGGTRPVVCAGCGGARLKARRLGVARVRKELEALTGTAVAVVSGSARRDAIDGVDVDHAAVVVGTEAALHRVRRADVVAFLEFDAELLAPRYAAAEQALALLARAARLVGAPGALGAPAQRAPGRVLVQTRLPQDDTLRAAVSADPGLLSRAEEDVRRALGLPPFGALALVSGEAADRYGRALASAAPEGASVSGPVDGVWSVRAPNHDVLCDLLASVARPTGRLRVEVDPARA